LELVFRTGSADFVLIVWVRDFDFTSAASGTAAAPVSGSVLAMWDIIRLAMPLVGWGSFSAEKKARWRGHWAAGTGLLWKPCAGCRTGDVELPDKNSGASWTREIVVGP
jgi:hypothetical protein